MKQVTLQMEDELFEILSRAAKIKGFSIEDFALQGIEGEFRSTVDDLEYADIPLGFGQEAVDRALKELEQAGVRKGGDGAG